MGLFGNCPHCGEFRVHLGPGEVHRWGCACSEPYCPDSPPSGLTPWHVGDNTYLGDVTGHPLRTYSQRLNAFLTGPCAAPAPWCEGTAYGWRPDLATGALAYAGRPLSVCRILLGGLVPPVCEVTR